MLPVLPMLVAEAAFESLFVWVFERVLFVLVVVRLVLVPVCFLEILLHSVGLQAVLVESLPEASAGHGIPLYNT